MKIRLCLTILVLALSATASYAQIECRACDPVNGSCSDPCWYCEQDSPDGYCPQQYVVQSTCGDRGLMNPGCIPDNCTPNWVVTSVENRGTYGQAENTYHFNPYYVIYACSHHVVDWVTEEDTNHCNQNSGYWTKNECTDHVDAWKSAAPNPPGNNTQYSNSNVPQDCCNERDVDFNPDPTFTCNHYHACF